MSIASRLIQLAGIKSDIKNALLSKGRAVGDNMADYAPAIRELEGDPNPIASDNDVIFVDYDGKIRYSYTREQFLALTQLPPNPVHEGLTAQGWNWTLSQIQEILVRGYYLVVGQNYITADGKTKLYLKIPTDAPTPITLYIKQSVANGVSVDWGDGSAEETSPSTDDPASFTHVYNGYGDYVISFNVAEGCVLTLGSTNYARSQLCGGTHSTTGRSTNVTSTKIWKVELGARVALGYAPFYGMVNLDAVSIPSYITNIGAAAFSGCGKCVPIYPPYSLVSAAADYNYYLSDLPYVSLPYDGVGKMIKNAPNLLVAPYCSLSSFSTAYGGCTFLTKISISSLVTSIDYYSFSSVRNIKILVCMAYDPPTVQGPFAGNIGSSCKIYVPYGRGNVYRGATNWTDLASQIFELDENGNIPTE